jgi:hypothetical protein
LCLSPNAGIEAIGIGIGSLESKKMNAGFEVIGIEK